jgi:hypothetical protein
MRRTIEEAAAVRRRLAGLRGRAVWSYVVEADEDEAGGLRLSVVSVLRLSEESGELGGAVERAYERAEVELGAALIARIGEELSIMIEEVAKHESD